MQIHHSGETTLLVEETLFCIIKSCLSTKKALHDEKLTTLMLALVPAKEYSFKDAIFNDAVSTVSHRGHVAKARFQFGMLLPGYMFS